MRSSQAKRIPMRVLSLVLLAIFGLSLMPLNNSSALSGAEFQPGRIIDDAIFYSGNASSVSQVSSFINSKVDCDTYGAKQYSSTMTRSQYAVSRGYPGVFTCLPQYRENPTTRENNVGSPGYSPVGSLSSAEIIVNAGRTHGVNPLALVVLLQKEQALVTDEWPFPRQYQIATGYGCPDTAACDTQYYGFYNQVNNAARQLKKYSTSPQNYRYKAGQDNAVYWHPNSSCGASTFRIENNATAALYNYTPYRPNQAALNNLYGSGDGCSSYGNRNFWRMYRDWFGQTLSNVPATVSSCPSGLAPVYRSYNKIRSGHLFTADYNELSFIYSNWGEDWSYEGKAFCARYPSVGSTFNAPVHRLYSDYLQQYILTADQNEVNILRNNGYWRYEGVAWYAPSNPNNTAGIPVKPVHRLYSDNLSRFLYTTDTNEKNVLSGTGYWRYEGVAWYAN